jgi:hypothetical protein
MVSKYMKKGNKPKIQVEDIGRVVGGVMKMRRGFDMLLHCLY